MKKILLLGSEGLLGSALLQTLGADFFVVAWDKAELDVTDRVEVLKKITALRPDYIINATAYNGVDEAERSESSFALARLINCDAVEYLAEAANDLGVPIVHFSTDYVFAGENKLGYKEDSMPKPVNNYGKSKAAGEVKLQEKAGKFYLLRLSRMFGPPGKSPAAKKSFVDQIIEIAKSKSEIKLVAEESSCPTYSLDLAALVKKILEENLPYGIYHGANSGVSTWFSFAEEIFRLKNINTKLIPIQSSEFQRVAKRPLYSELINTKLPKQRPWQDALGEYLKK